MSGIYGIYRYDGAPVEPQWLERMRSAMAYYGPDGGGCRISGRVGMGHLLREVNPEDGFERQPIEGERGLVVCAARLDNRDELLDTFKILAGERPRLSDGRLVGLAFDRWGEELCPHLEGDWALAAWNEKERRLILGRDVFGFGALYYHQGHGFIAFASSMKALLALPGTAKEPDLLGLADVLVGWHVDADLTAYKGFRALLGAHTMSVEADGRTHVRRFWSFGGRELLRYRRDEDYVDAFLEHYTRAVRSCLRTQKPVAAELSGGRDSGSVVALAAPILSSQGRELTAYTSVPYFPPDGAGEGRIGNEWDLAQATATMAGANVRHIPIDARDYGVIAGVEHHFDMHDGPGHAASSQYWVQAVMEAAPRDGAAVILVGQTGNATVSWMGNASAVLALRQGYPAVALRLLLHGEANPWQVLKRQVIKPLVTPGRRLLQRLRNRRPGSWHSYCAINVEFARQLDLKGRLQASGYDPTGTVSPFDDLWRLFFEPAYGTGPSIWAEASAWHSVDCLDPTANLALLEFLLRVPDDQFFRNGERSFLFKRALQTRMPEAVVYPKQKGLQSADLGHRIVREQAEFQECLRALESDPLATMILDLPLLERCLNEVLGEVNPQTTARAVDILVRGIGVGLSLRRVANTGS